MNQTIVYGVIQTSAIVERSNLDLFQLRACVLGDDIQSFTTPWLICNGDEIRFELCKPRLVMLSITRPYQGQSSLLLCPTLGQTDDCGTMQHLDVFLSGTTFTSSQAEVLLQPPFTMDELRSILAVMKVDTALDQIVSHPYSSKLTGN